MCFMKEIFWLNVLSTKPLLFESPSWDEEHIDIQALSKEFFFGDLFLSFRLWSDYLSLGTSTFNFWKMFAAV